MAVSYTSIQAYGDALYKFCTDLNLAKSICNSHKSGTKNHMKHSKPDGFSLAYASNNLEAISQEFVNGHLTSAKTTSPNAPAHIEIVPGETWEYTIHKFDANVHQNTVTVTNTTDFSVSGDASYGGASVGLSYEETTEETETDINNEVSADATTYKLTFTGLVNPYDVDFFSYKYTCSLTAKLPVTYTFSTITYAAVCDYTDGALQKWNNEHYHKTYNIAELGFDPVVTVEQDVVFNIDYDNPWPSYTITYK